MEFAIKDFTIPSWQTFVSVEMNQGGLSLQSVSGQGAGLRAHLDLSGTPAASQS